MKKYKVIGNPAAGRGRGLEVFQKTKKIFSTKGLSGSFELTQNRNDAGHIARESLTDFDVIVCIGGDGTLNEIIQGMIYSGKPIGIIPAGSGNDFFKCLNISGGLETIIDAITSTEPLTIDAGRFNNIYFINGAGVGFDAAVNYATKKIKKVKGFAAYFWGMIKTLKQYHPLRLKITINGSTIEQHTFLLAIGNGSVCGGGFKLNPYAKIDDNLLDVNIVDPISVPKLLWHLPKVFAGTIDRTRYAKINRTATLAIENYETLPVHIDGEEHLLEAGIHTIDVIPDSLKVIGKPQR